MSAARRGAEGQARKARDAEQDGRERILSAAIRAFSEMGFEGTSTAGIARAAGVTQPLVHHHFGSKDGVWRAAMDVVFSQVPPLTAFPATALPREMIVAIVERFVRFVSAHPEATRIIAREGAKPSPRLAYLLKRHLRAPFREVVALVRAAQAAGAVAPDVRPELVLFLVLGAGSHLFDVTALAEGSVGIDTTSPATAEAFVALLQGLLERGLFRRAR